ncbi:MAG TPA: glycosyltransferase family 4 protein [Chitinophagaceae bacterium]|nr:glycosyltransferase family 4 protein [Chitinophagaceae bacterium]
MKIKKPTLIILTPGFATDETDSTCLPFLQIFLKKLKENYPELKILVLTFQYPFFKGLYIWEEIEIISFNGRNRKKLFKLVLWNRILRKLKKIHSENNIIGILSLWCGECAWIGKRFSRKYNLKHYCWLWGQDARKENKFVKRIHPDKSELIALSDFLQSEFEKNFLIRPVHVIPPGIDPGQFNTKKLSRDIDILGVGSLIPLKRYDEFLYAVSELKKDYPDIKVVLCGNGPEEESLQIQKTKLNLSDNIQFTGEIPHPDVLQLMQRSKILLHPSSFEGFGCVCLEALYAGANVISFCKPMKQEIKNWHIVQSEKEMIQRSIQILQSSPCENESILPYSIDDSVKKIMNLFS